MSLFGVNTDAVKYQEKGMIYMKTLDENKYFSVSCDKVVYGDDHQFSQMKTTAVIATGSPYIEMPYGDFINTLKHLVKISPALKFKDNRIQAVSKCANLNL